MRIHRAMLTMQFKRAEQKLSDSSHKESWRELLEKEAQDFSAALSEWKELQSRRYENARERLLAKWESAAIRTRVKELEYSLKMQRKRLQIMMEQFHLCPVTAAA
jgi:stearoyl-CoA desaturase (Delta-9 desaturase)